MSARSPARASGAHLASPSSFRFWAGNNFASASRCRSRNSVRICWVRTAFRRRSSARTALRIRMDMFRLSADPHGRARRWRRRSWKPLSAQKAGCWYARFSCPVPVRTIIDWLPSSRIIPGSASPAGRPRTDACVYSPMIRSQAQRINCCTVLHPGRARQQNKIDASCSARA